MTAFQKLSGFRGESSFKTWLLSITWRKAIDRRKSVTRWMQRLVAPQPASETGEEWDPMQGLASGGQSQEEELMTADLQRRLRPLIASLPKKLRDALLLAGSGDHSYDEIGGMLGIPTGTVKWRVSEARKVLRQKMAAMGYDGCLSRRTRSEVRRSRFGARPRDRCARCAQMLDVEPPAGLPRPGAAPDRPLLIDRWLPALAGRSALAGSSSGPPSRSVPPRVLILALLPTRTPEPARPETSPGLSPSRHLRSTRPSLVPGPTAPGIVATPRRTPHGISVPLSRGPPIARSPRQSSSRRGKERPPSRRSRRSIRSR